MLGTLRRYVIRNRFKKLFGIYDQAIADAQAKHQPVKHLQDAKAAAVRAALEGAVRS